MDNDFSREYDPDAYKEDKRFVIAFKEAKVIQILYFLFSVLTIVLIYAISPSLGEPTALLMGYPAWFVVVKALWVVLFVVMLGALKFWVKTVSFDAKVKESEVK